MVPSIDNFKARSIKKMCAVELPNFLDFQFMLMQAELEAFMRISRSCPRVSEEANRLLGLLWVQQANKVIRMHM
jgi:hypothetical protein